MIQIRQSGAATPPCLCAIDRIGPGAHQGRHPLGRCEFRNQPIEAVVFIPHMHWRGKDMTYKVTYPTGETQTLLTASNFSFDWQLAYELAKPASLPKGSRIEVTAHYDNSPNNIQNPYIGETARWGDQTWNEMFIGSWVRWFQ